MKSEWAVEFMLAGVSGLAYVAITSGANVRSVALPEGSK